MSLSSNSSSPPFAQISREVIPLTSLLIILKAFTESFPDSAEISNAQGVQALPAAVSLTLFSLFTSPPLPLSSFSIFTGVSPLLSSTFLRLPFVRFCQHSFGPPNTQKMSWSCLRGSSVRFFRLSHETDDVIIRNWCSKSHSPESQAVCYSYVRNYDRFVLYCTLNAQYC